MVDLESGPMTVNAAVAGSRRRRRLFCPSAARSIGDCACAEAVAQSRSTMGWGRMRDLTKGGGLGTPRGVRVQKALEVVDVEGWRKGEAWPTNTAPALLTPLGSGNEAPAGASRNVKVCASPGPAAAAKVPRLATRCLVAMLGSFKGTATTLTSGGNPLLGRARIEIMKGGCPPC